MILELSQLDAIYKATVCRERSTLKTSSHRCCTLYRIAGADIKDKQPLMDARKSIEKDMERFKVCERETKMMGRVGGPKIVDPKDKAKEDARDWINNTVDSLQSKVSIELG